MNDAAAGTPQGRDSKRTTRRATTIAAVSVAMLVGGGVLGGVLSSDRGSSFVQRAAAAIAQPEKIEHVKATSDGVTYETWSLGSRGSVTIVTLPDGRTSRSEGSPICSVLSLQLPGGPCLSIGQGLSETMASTPDSAVSAGTIGGRRVRRIPFSMASRDISGIYDVDPDTLQPVRLTVNGIMRPGANG